MSLTNPNQEFEQLGVSHVIVEGQGREVTLPVTEFVKTLPTNEMLGFMYGRQNVLMGLTDTIALRNKPGFYPVQSRFQKLISRFRAKREAKAILDVPDQRLTYGVMQMLLYKLAFGAINRPYLASYTAQPNDTEMTPFFYYPQVNPFAFDVNKTVVVDESKGRSEETTIRLAGACIPYEPTGMYTLPRLGLLWDGMSESRIPRGLVRHKDALTRWDLIVLNKGYEGRLRPHMPYVDFPGLRIASQIPLNLDRVVPLNLIDYRWKYGERTLLYVYAALVPCMHDSSRPRTEIHDSSHWLSRFVGIEEGENARNIMSKLDTKSRVVLEQSGLTDYDHESF